MRIEIWDKWELGQTRWYCKIDTIIFTKRYKMATLEGILRQIRKDTTYRCKK